MKLKVSDKFSLPPEAASDAIAIVGRRGRGKTTTAVVLVEEIAAAGDRFVVADPVGVWWGLKSTRDGKGKGIPVIVMGGEHADVPLEETSGRVIADFVIDPTSPSVILDFRGFRKSQITRFMVDFLEQLYHKNRHPLHVVLDEADQFAPQRVMGETARMVGACEDVCKMGRARGLFPILITQRPAALNKNVLTQAGLLITHQLTGPQDRKALDDWIRANAEETERAKFIETVPTLPKGVAWFWLPEQGIFERVSVRDRRTYDSSSTPKSGAVSGPKVKAEVDLEALKLKISATIEKAKLTDPKELQRRIVVLEKELAKKPAPVVEVKQKVVKVKAFTDAQVKRLEILFARMIKEAERHGTAMNLLWGNFNEVGESFVKAMQSVVQVQKAPAEKTVVVHKPVAVGKSTFREGDNGQLQKGERIVLTAIAQDQRGVTHEQLTVLTGYKATSRRTYLQRLSQRGLISVQGDNISATDAGVSALGDFVPLPTGDALREYWMQRLNGGEKALLEIVVAVHPKSITRDHIEEKSGYKTTSVRTFLQRLSARKLVSVSGSVVTASEEIFG